MRDPSPYAGKTVQLRADALELGGLPCEVADWYERTGQRLTWRAALLLGEPRAQSYNIRRARSGLPDDDEVLLGKVDGMGAIVHVSEIEGADQSRSIPAEPKTTDSRAVGQPCPACQAPLTDTDTVAVVALGPGADEAARRNCAAGYDYAAVVVELHWACRTGDESYEITKATEA